MTDSPPLDIFDLYCTFYSRRASAFSEFLFVFDKSLAKLCPHLRVFSSEVDPQNFGTPTPTAHNVRDGLT